MDDIIESKTCKQCSVSFDITKQDIEFYKKVSPVFGGMKYSIPTPNLCPECRSRRRLSFRNERSLYKRKCDATNKDIISIYAPKRIVSGNNPSTIYKVYDAEFWWSDRWDVMDYNIDLDFSLGFLAQFSSLIKKVPRIAMMSVDSENSDYTNQSYDNKNCYMSFAIANCEDINYAECATYNTDCIDIGYTQHSSVSYDTIDSENLSFCFHMDECVGCNNCRYCDDCISCSNCFGCIGLRNKSYCIFNKQYTKQEYKNEIKKYDKNTEPEEYKQLKKKFPRRAVKNTGCSNVVGNNLRNCSDSQQCFDCHELENCKYSSWIFTSNNCFDCYGMGGGEFVYEGISVERIKKSIANTIVSDSYNMFYSDLCFYSNNCFGCVGLKNKSYCILNKQYTKEEYEILVPKIIEKMEQDGEWGEFFPSSLSPFGYNETVANECFPLTREEVLHSQLTPSPSLDNRGEQDNKVLSLEKGEDLGVGGGLKRGPIFNWSDYEAPFPKVEKIIPAGKLPEKIEDIPDDILNWAIECEVTRKPFRIIKPELEFYRKHDLPIPKRHPDQRHLDRMNLRNPRKLYKRNCDKCDKDIQTTYAPDRKETVYCETCYNKNTY